MTPVPSTSAARLVNVLDQVGAEWGGLAVLRAAAKLWPDAWAQIMADARKAGRAEAQPRATVTAAQVAARVEAVLESAELYDVLCTRDHSKGWSHDEVDRLIRAALPAPTEQP